MAVPYFDHIRQSLTIVNSELLGDAVAVRGCVPQVRRVDA